MAFQRLIQEYRQLAEVGNPKQLAMKQHASDIMNATAPGSGMSGFGKIFSKPRPAQMGVSKGLKVHVLKKKVLPPPIPAAAKKPKLGAPPVPPPEAFGVKPESIRAILNDYSSLVEGGGSRLTKPARQAVHLSKYPGTPRPFSEPGNKHVQKYWQRHHSRNDGMDMLKMRQHVAKAGIFGKKVKYPAKLPVE